MSDITWRQRAENRWIAKDIDGYELIAEATRGLEWHWRIRPPGGGYDLHRGTAGSGAEAKQAAEARLAALSQEIKRRLPRT